MKLPVLGIEVWRWGRALHSPLPFHSLLPKYHPDSAIGAPRGAFPCSLNEEAPLRLSQHPGDGSLLHSASGPSPDTSPEKTLILDQSTPSPLGAPSSAPVSGACRCC